MIFSLNSVPSENDKLFVFFPQTTPARIAFTSYKDANLFQAPGVSVVNNESFVVTGSTVTEVINSPVLGATVRGCQITGLQTPVQILYVPCMR